MYGADALFLMLDQSVFSIRMRNTVWMAPDGRVVVVVVLVVVVVVVQISLVPLAVQQERHTVALCLHSERASMNLWRASLLHERLERPEAQSRRADPRSARVCVRQFSFCEAQDVLHSRHALSHLFLAASIGEALTNRRTRASSVRRHQARGAASHARRLSAPGGLMVGLYRTRFLGHQGRLGYSPRSRPNSQITPSWVDQLRSFASEVTRVAREVGTEGKLGGQADVKGVAGTWKDLTDSVSARERRLDRSGPTVRAAGPRSAPTAPWPR